MVAPDQDPVNLPMKPASTVLAVALGLAAVPACADIGVRFIEGAPKDRFEITNLAACAVVTTEVAIDLGASAAGPVFDVTGEGVGVEVFQPFELVAGADALASLPAVVDGDRQVVLSIRRLAPGIRIAFTIDVDDTISPRGITVSGSEIEGAVLRVNVAGTTSSGRFSRQGEALVQRPPRPWRGLGAGSAPGEKQRPRRHLLPRQQHLRDHTQA